MAAMARAEKRNARKKSITESREEIHPRITQSRLSLKLTDQTYLRDLFQQDSRIQTEIQLVKRRLRDQDEFLRKALREGAVQEDGPLRAYLQGRTVRITKSR